MRLRKSILIVNQNITIKVLRVPRHISLNSQ